MKIVGPSGAGKTTLAERLIHDWAKSGLRVGYLKHAAHGFDLDRPGKDSDRATRAGARGVALFGPGAVAFLEMAADGRAEDLAERFFSGYDVVVVEGFGVSELPSIVFAETRKGPGAKARAAGDVIAIVVASGRLGGSPPRVLRDDVDAIRVLVERRLELPARAR